MVAVILGQTAFAQSLPMETSQSIGIIDFVIKKSKYEEVSCGAHSCQMKSVEGGVNLKLTHSTMQQDRDENLHYLLQVSVKGTLFSTKVEVHYRNDPNLQTLKTGKRIDEIFCRTFHADIRHHPQSAQIPFFHFLKKFKLGIVFIDQQGMVKKVFQPGLDWFQSPKIHDPHLVIQF